MSGSPKRFKKPPLLEVYCEFLFDPPEGDSWEGLQVCEFVGLIGEGYTQHRMMHHGGVQIRLHDEEGDYWGHGDPDDIVPLFRFSTDDGSTTVQVGENLLVVNQLPPYYGWSRYGPRVLDGIKAYSHVWKPVKVVQAFLHYVDRVLTPQGNFEFRDYFNLYAVLPPAFDRPYTNLSLSFDIEGCGRGDVLSVAVQQVSSPDPDGMSFLLNWDYGSTEPIELDPELSRVREWLEAAHTCCGYYFQSLFTDRCFALFEPDED